MPGSSEIDTEDVGGGRDSVARVKVVLGAIGTDGGDVSAANPLPVSIAAAGTNDVDVLTIAAGDNNIGNVDVVTINAVAPAFGTGALGATVLRVTQSTDDAGVLSLGIMDDWDNAASDGASVSGDVAHDGVDAGEPVKVGHVAIAHGTNPAAVAAADRTNSYANRAGIPFHIGGHPNVIALTAIITDAAGAQTDAAIITVGAGEKIVVTRVSVAAHNANTVNVNVKVGFGTATLPADASGGAAGILLHHPGVPAGGGMTVGDGSGILGVGADNEDVRLTCADPVTGSVTVSISYYTVPS